MEKQPQWNLDVKTAKWECRRLFGQWEAHFELLRDIVEECESFTPEEFYMHLEELLPDFRTTTLAAIARVEILHQIFSGEMPVAE